MTEHPRTVLVTGARRGLGFEACRQLAERGCHVWLTARAEPDARAAARRLADRGLQVTPLPLDIADDRLLADAVRAVEAGGGLDVLVNNAGVLPDPTGDVTQVSPGQMRQAFETNTLGTLRVTQAFLPLLQRGRDPRVVNVSSGAGALSDMGAWAPAYSMSKTALNAITLQLALALKPRGIAVNAMCPGWVRTEMGGPNAPRSVEQGADTMVWLSLDAPQDLTGQFLRDRQPIAW